MINKMSNDLNSNCLSSFVSNNYTGLFAWSMRSRKQCISTELDEDDDDGVEEEEEEDSSKKTHDDSCENDDDDGGSDSESSFNKQRKRKGRSQVQPVVIGK